METITRRVFLKRAISSVGGVIIAGSVGSRLGMTQDQAANMSKVIIAKHQEATDGVRIINAANVQSMMDESIKEITGQASVADAWGSLLSDFREDHLVAVKVNAICAQLPTHPVLVDAITSGLIAAGVPDNNIIIFDALRTNGWKQRIINAGYTYNASDAGVRCIETNEKGWGYDWDNRVDIVGRKIALSSIVTRCDHLINVPVLKWLNWMPTSTLSLKNHYGTINAPNNLHGNFAEACATLNSQPDIRDKTRIVVIDALFGCSTGQLNPPNFAPNSLILSRDPVAADYIGTEMLSEERARLKLAPQGVFYVDKAAEMGLGVGDPERIELVKMELGTPEGEEVEELEEEEAGQSVEPTDSYITQWGATKT